MKGNPQKLAYAHFLLNSIWGLISLGLLLLVFFLTSQKEEIQTQELLFYAGDEVADNLDNLVNELIQAVDSNLGHDFKSCDSKLISAFQHVTFNHLEISGIIIKDFNDKFLCGNMPQTINIPLEKHKFLTLIGPLHINESDKPVFIIQQQLGDYYIQIFLLKEVITKALSVNAPIAQWIGLYDINQNKIILRVNYNQGVWKETQTTPREVSLVKSSDVIKMPLNLSHFQIIIKANPQVIRSFILRHEALALLLMFTLATLIYFYLRRVISRHFSIHGEIMSTIKNKNFFPYYQPIVESKTNRFCGAEVLLRWRTSEDEIIMPDLFIEDAEESGLIIPITLQLIEIAFKECQLLLRENDFHLAFNLSSIHFTDNKFFNTFLALCRSYNIPPTKLMLEITERDLLRHDDLSIVIRMKELRLNGFSLAIDDFGTGHASISYLQHFPFNYLKIDQLFIRAIGTGAVTETLNQSIIQMANNLKLNIIAEGVETIAQQKFLQEQNVHLMQGWYFAKAMPVERLVQFIKESSL